jgi:hypothetical protein
MPKDKTVYSKNIVQTSRLSGLPAFRFPDVDIEGFVTSGDVTQTDENVDFSCLPETPPPLAEIGVPEDLAVEGQPRIVKKGTTSFVDVDISFVPADGAVRHQFRIAKFVAEEE